MAKVRAYSIRKNCKGIATAPALLALVLALNTISGGIARAQDDPLYDEILVYISLPYLGVSEIDALIKDQEAYLPVVDLFNFLKIKNTPSDDFNTVTGFFINPDATYTVDRQNNTIIYGGRTWEPEEGALVRTEANLYLRSDWYGRVFGLDCRFNFRELTVRIDSKLELPAIREMKQEEMRANMTRLRGEIRVDTTVGRTYPGFRFGMADWSVYAIEHGGGATQARLNLSLGSVIAGGEATASLNYYTGDKFSEKQQYYLWRHVNNDRNFLRQVMAGKITTHATASVYDPVVGIQLTNTPTTFRRSFGTYTLTDMTEPGWTVELYVNNVLVDYVRADASGFFTFEVPLVYGNTKVKLKFYGPWGEERTREQNLSIPYNFIPRGELEYTVSAGVVEDSLWSRFSRASINYGVTRFLTIGGGAEYLSSVTSGPFMPFVNASVRLPGNVLLSGEYTHGVRARGTLAYRLPSNIQIDLDWVRYDRGQRAISYNYLEERRAAVSLPVRLGKLSAYSRLSYYQIVLPSVMHTTAEWLIAGSFPGVSTNLTTYGVFAGKTDPNIYSALSLGVRLPREFLLIPQVQYSYTDKMFLSTKLSLEKRIFENGYMNLSFERNFRYNLSMGEIGLRYNFSFAQTGVSARRTNDLSTFVQYARGSLINDSPTRWLKADNGTNVGRGGISVVAFLDLNADGRYEAGEPRIPGLNVRSNSGKLERSGKDTTIHITGLEPYSKVYIDVDESSFDNISWRLEKRSYAVIIDPNMLKLIEVPVYVRGEATGYVMLDEEGAVNGLGRVIVTFSDNGDGFTGSALTEEDGYFSYFGLKPGKYTVGVDTTQLRKLGMTSEPGSINFSIRTDIEGDYVQGLNFTLRKIALSADTLAAADTTAMNVPDTLPARPPERVIETDTSYLVIHEETRELVTITEDYYAVQFGAFLNKTYAEIMKQKVEAALDKNVELFEEDGFWKVRITGFNDREDLEKYIPVIHDQGITEIWVIMNRAVRGDWITTSREDSLAVTRETETEKPVPMIIAGNALQLGAFESVEETGPVSDRLLAATEKLVTIRKEDGVYKIQITGFADTNEIRDFIPILQQHGFKDITVLHQTRSGLVPAGPQLMPEAEEQVIIPEIKEIPAPLPEPDIRILQPEQPEISEQAVPPPPTPRFILHAGYYHKRSQAERARRKIERNLDMPVEIIEEWDSFRVVVTGFFTREETYPYYPELAGLGFSDVFVYEKPVIDR